MHLMTPAPVLHPPKWLFKNDQTSTQDSLNADKLRFLGLNNNRVYLLLKKPFVIFSE